MLRLLLLLFIHYFRISCQNTKNIEPEMKGERHEPEMIRRIEHEKMT